MLILGIETSCDETAAAIVKDGQTILAHQVASSLPLHAKTGGIIPEVAARQQLRCFLPILAAVLQQAFGWEPKDIGPLPVEAIAVTQGPGLISSLLVGLESAKMLAAVWKKRLLPVNHLQAHLYANWLEKTPHAQPKLPAIGLIVSGGHTDLVLIKKNSFRWLGGTRDDAAGECLDKTARLLQLGYPGGPAIEKAARSGHEKRLVSPLPRPMIDQPNFDFSFSGLKTAVAVSQKKSSPRKSDLAAGIQNAITDVLVEKTLRAVDKYRPSSLVLGGGVAANHVLVSTFRKEIGRRALPVSFFAPPPRLCTDNAAAIAACAFFRFRSRPLNQITAQPNLGAVS